LKILNIKVKIYFLVITGCGFSQCTFEAKLWVIRRRAAFGTGRQKTKREKAKKPRKKQI